MACRELEEGDFAFGGFHEAQIGLQEFQREAWSLCRTRCGRSPTEAFGGGNSRLTQSHAARRRPLWHIRARSLQRTSAAQHAITLQEAAAIMGASTNTKGGGSALAPSKRAE